MRKLMFALVIAAMTLMPMAASAQGPAFGQAEQPFTYNDDWFYPLFLAAGAVAGVVVVNMFTSGYVGNIPYWTGITSNAPVTDMTATALSRVYAVTGVVVGGWLANWLYTGQ